MPPDVLGFRRRAAIASVAGTLVAIGASKAVDRDRQVRKGGDQMTFVAAQERPGSEHGSGLRQAIDVPVYWLAAYPVFDLDQCALPFMGTCLDATIRDGVLKVGHRT